MKKALIILSVVALLGVLSTSCKKTCECTTYANDAILSTEEFEYERGDIDKCSDLNTLVTIGGQKTGVECK